MSRKHVLAHFCGLCFKCQLLFKAFDCFCGLLLRATQRPIWNLGSVPHHSSALKLFAVLIDRASREKSLLHPCDSGMSEACSLNFPASKRLHPISSYLFVNVPFVSKKKVLFPWWGVSSPFTLLGELYVIFFLWKKIKNIFWSRINIGQLSSL